MTALALSTPRLKVVAGTAELLRAQLLDPAAWQRLLGARVPDGWPPDLTEDAWEYTYRWLVHDPSAVGWSMWYFVRTGPDPVIVGAGGFKGRPDQDGTVETGYSVVADFQRQGFACEAVGALCEWAFRQQGVTRVIAHTYPHLVASIGVLNKLGFRLVEGSHEEGTIRYEKQGRGERGEGRPA